MAGPCAECVVRGVRTPTEGGGCCNGAAHGTSRKCTAGPCTEGRGQVRAGPRMEIAVHGARSRKEGESAATGLNMKRVVASAAGP